MPRPNSEGADSTRGDLTEPPGQKVVSAASLLPVLFIVATASFFPLVVVGLSFPQGPEGPGFGGPGETLLSTERYSTLLLCTTR